ncbi:hypothetical protein RhiirB3_533727, partial [Rhizophagus irregularis]
MIIRFKNQHRDFEANNRNFFLKKKSDKVRSNTLTEPKSPYLRTKYRSKPTTILPTEERKIREMRGYRFKANPLDRKILENRNFGIPKVQKPKLT